ncbi:MAG: nucleoside monophosphate kinase [Chlamydiales bacterium]|nr:nucleoside monophosphate kinase [Chlamydiales bacterium]
MNNNPAIYVLFGRPGAGKGTFSQTLQSHGYLAISTGDITRKEVQFQTPFGVKYKKAILNHITGGVPSEEIQKIVEQRLEESLQNQNGAILDGYPKTVEQCRLLERFVEKFELEDRIAYLLLDVEEQEAVERILFRQLCVQCGQIYNLKWLAPKVKNTCDACQGKLYQRLDAYMERSKERIYKFKEQYRPILDYYEGRLKVLNTTAPLKECIEMFLKFHNSFKQTNHASTLKS